MQTVKYLNYEKMRPVESSATRSELPYDTNTTVGGGGADSDLCIRIYSLHPDLLFDPVYGSMLSYYSMNGKGVGNLPIKNIDIK